MTNEILEKGIKLQAKTRNLEQQLEKIRNWKGRTAKAGRFSMGSIYSVEFPFEIAEKIETLLEIELSVLLQNAYKEFEELGIEKERNDRNE